MTIKTSILNIFRSVSKIRFIEEALANQINNGNNFATKLIASNYLYPKNSIRNCTRNGIIYTLDISDYMEHGIYFGIYDGPDFDRTQLYSLIKPNYICFDIGANIGETTLNFAQIAKNGKVYSFEPVPFLFERLKKNVQQNKFENIFLNNIAISDRKETLFFSTPINNNSAGIGLQKNKEEKSNAVFADTLDNFVDENKIERIDFIKIDVEGFENFVINGAINTLKSLKPILFIEIDNHHLLKNNTSEAEILTKLSSLGYTLFAIEEKSKIEITSFENTNKHYDVLCIPIA